MSTVKTIKISQGKVLDYSIQKEGFKPVIGSSLITSSKNININMVSTESTNSVYNFGDRIGGMATVVGEYSSNDGKKYAFAVLDAQYRGTNIKWSTGLNGTDTGLPNYSSAPTEQNKESATYNTDYIINNYSDKAIEAFTFCRNVGSILIGDKQLNPQLPNAYELQQIFNMKTELDALDPTAETNSTKKLSNWGFGSNSEYVLTSNECSKWQSWEMGPSGSYNNYSKRNGNRGVCPIIEIPISDNTPSEETSKEFTITSNADNATILVNEVQ